MPMPANLDDRIQALEAENQRLRDHIEILEDALGVGQDHLTPVEWMLTGKEMRVFGVLMAREVASKDMIMAGIYTPDVDDEPMIKIVDVFVCKVRKKLKPFGIEIETRWGEGYWIRPEIKAVAQQLMGHDAEVSPASSLGGGAVPPDSLVPASVKIPKVSPGETAGAATCEERQALDVADVTFQIKPVDALEPGQVLIASPSGVDRIDTIRDILELVSVTVAQPSRPAGQPVPIGERSPRTIQYGHYVQAQFDKGLDAVSIRASMNRQLPVTLELSEVRTIMTELGLTP